MNETAAPALPHNLSPWNMFTTADIVVQVVMLGLLAAAVLTWIVCLAKAWELGRARRETRRSLALLQESESLSACATDDDHATLALFCSVAQRERSRSGTLPVDGIKARAAARLDRVQARLGRRIARGTGVLASIGATAPFVGLFGTVWGIMNSFVGIAQAQTTNLAVVAPGIAEALLATAFGLFAAIPAVIIYNVLARGMAGYRGLLGDITTEVLNLLGRDLDRARP